MTSPTKDGALLEFQNIHDEYLKTICEYLNPDERKPLLEESLQKFKDIMGKAQDASTTVADLQGYIEAIKHAKEDIMYLRGTCCKECVMNLLRMQDLVMSSSIACDKFRANPDMIVSLMMASNDMVAGALREVLVICQKADPTWKIREKVHDVYEKYTGLLHNMSEAIQAGHVITLRLPSEDKEKYKETLN